MIRRSGTFWTAASTRGFVGLLLTTLWLSAAVQPCHASAMSHASVPSAGSQHAATAVGHTDSAEPPCSPCSHCMPAIGAPAPCCDQQSAADCATGSVFVYNNRVDDGKNQPRLEQPDPPALTPAFVEPDEFVPDLDPPAFPDFQWAHSGPSLFDLYSSYIE